MIGNARVFAARSEVDESIRDEWLFGKMYFVLKGTDIGDYVLRTSLRTVAMLLVPIVKDGGKRQHKWLSTLPAPWTIEAEAIASLSSIR